MKGLIARDISWLSFNARVLQEANDKTVPLKERIRFLGIHSNNMDEFFRIRVATLKRMIELGGKKANMHLEEKPQIILDQIQAVVLQQQTQFNNIWQGILQELRKKNIYLVNEKRLTIQQKSFVKNYFEEEVRSIINPLMIESIPQLPYLREKSIYLGVVMHKNNSPGKKKYAVIEIPSKILGRFVQIPSPPRRHTIILLEDLIRFNLPYIFSYFGYDTYEAHIFKVTKDAEFDIDNDVFTTFVQKVEKGVKSRKLARTVRFSYDRNMDADLLSYLLKKLNVSGKDNIIPGGSIHNFRHFMDFPDVFPKKIKRNKPFIHPELKISNRVTDVIEKKNILLHFPYHSFNSLIDLLREAAIDPNVFSIKITAYRLAPQSKIINALINAARNGKQVIVMLELRARFDEEANLQWKKVLEEEGIKVLLGVPNMKVHAKICVIKKRKGKKTMQYGFVSTGNLNEKTALVYADNCLLTSNRNIMADINRIFKYLENPSSGLNHLKACKTLLVCPINTREVFLKFIQNEIREAKAGNPAYILVKVNSLSDSKLINKLYEAAEMGVKVDLIVRGIFCIRSEQKKLNQRIHAISIVDEYLEHARILLFHNKGKEKIFISSADWMVRNLDHRVEATVPLSREVNIKELKDILNIQLSDNVKARILDNTLSNHYVTGMDKKKVRAQIATFQYLLNKNHIPS
ncbi:MAG: polyphosphate kinase 1 [Bacteroidetes bacterium]|nr:polyphosphate kinase 1 [Bacteroidota bacterium]